MRLVLAAAPAAAAAAAAIVVLVVLPLSAPHDPETLAWLNSAGCAELEEWMEERRGTLERYQETAGNIHRYKGCPP